MVVFVFLTTNAVLVSLNQQVNKLIKEAQKCSCKGKKAPLSNKNEGGETAKKEGGSKGSLSSEEGMSPTKAKDADQENVFTTPT